MVAYRLKGNVEGDMQWLRMDVIYCRWLKTRGKYFEMLQVVGRVTKELAKVVKVG